MKLDALTDEDLAGLTAWCEPLARMDNPAVSRWASTAWHAITDERARREGGAPAVTPWPAFDPLPTEALVLVSRLLTGTRLAGSNVLRLWVEEAGEQIVDVLVARADPDE